MKLFQIEHRHPSMFWRNLFITAFLLSRFFASSFAFELPDQNQGHWRVGIDVGVRGGYEQYLPGGSNQRTFLIDITKPPYSADNTGTTDASDAIRSAINAAKPGEVIYLPAGLYRIDQYIYITKNDITVRGDGPDKTRLRISNSGFFIASGPGASTQNRTSITGNKSKGTATISVDNTAGYQVGKLVTVAIENEEDPVRIQAGAPPTWTPSGFRNARRTIHEITDVGAGTISLDPPLLWDSMVYEATIEIGSGGPQRYRVGFEDFSIDAPSPTNHFAGAIRFIGALDCWAHNIRSYQNKNAANGYVVDIYEAKNITVSHSHFILAEGASSDGGVHVTRSSSLLIQNNIFDGNDVGFYDSSALGNSVLAYNLFVNVGKAILLGHGASQSNRLLFEGNVSQNYQADGYHGGTAYNTFFRNWFYSYDLKNDRPSWTLSANRFTRYTAHVGNVMGWDGKANAAESYGNPNLGNGYFDGESKMTSGDFPADWLVTGTLVNRLSDSEGIFDMSGGDWDGNGLMGNPSPRIWWNNYENSRNFMIRGTVNGSLVTLSGGNGDVLPPESTVVHVWTQWNGFQEKDLDCEATTLNVHNYRASVSGSGSLQNPSGALPSSLAYATKPTWFGNLTWPPVNPDNPLFDFEIIPAGVRYLGGVVENSDFDQTNSEGRSGVSFGQFNNVLTSSNRPMRISLIGDGDVEIQILNRLGQKIRTLKGANEILWDGNNSNGEPVSSGTYTLLLKTSESSDQKKVVVIK